MPAELLKISNSKPEPKLVSYAAERIRQGQVLGMPTDTFYGLAADPVNLRAVDRIYEIKSRSRHKPLSLLVESVDQAADLSRNPPDVFHQLANKYWPGPLTIIVKASSRLPLKVTANTGNVALRVPDAIIPVAIIREIGWEIKNGKLGRMLKNPSYSGITTEFWNSMDAICSRDQWTLWGTPNCGKGQPMQTMGTGHGAAPARFRDVTVGSAYKGT